MAGVNRGIADPWAGTIKWLLMAFGVVMLLCLVVPWQLGDSPQFAWDLFDAGGPFRTFAITIAATGVAAVALAARPVDTVVRGWASIVIGLGPIAWAVARRGSDFDWRSLVIMLSLVMLAAGFLLRGQRRMSLIARAACTLGFVGLILAYVTPDHGQMHLARIMDRLDHVSGKLKLVPLLDMAPLVVGALGLLAWRAPAAGRRASDLAWLAILVLPLGMMVNVVVLLGEERFGVFVRQQLFLLIQLPIIITGWMALAAHGLAIVAGDAESRSDGP